MSVKVSKVSLIPVPEEDIGKYLLDEILKRIEPVRKIIDDYGAKYDHEVPWKTVYAKKPKFYLYRVDIGAIGRVANCKDAVILGLLAKATIRTRHFTSMALYYIFKIARQTSKEYLHVKDLENWTNGFLQGSVEESRYLNYYNIENNV